MEDKEVVLLRHFVMDQMYALLAYTPPLDAGAFNERGYVITYYDAPLQAGIEPSWSDQNGPSGRAAGLAQLRTVDAETVERRRLAALEWATAGAPAAPLAPKRVPGEGLTDARLELAAKMLAQREPDLGFQLPSLNSPAPRVWGSQPCQEMLDLEAGGLKAYGSTQLMAIVLSVCDDPEANRAAQAGLAGPLGLALQKVLWKFLSHHVH
ncbi:unnamed protein product [Effrenium voratum]|nr:unnamed protein product [Effrenium voratum]